MRLRVEVRCVECGYETEVHVWGSWDIKNVVHNCAFKTPRGEIYHEDRALEPGRFGVDYDPPRRVF